MISTDNKSRNFQLKQLALSLGLGFSLIASTGAALAQDIKIALIAGKTGALEPYAKETETGI